MIQLIPKPKHVIDFQVNEKRIIFVQKGKIKGKTNKTGSNTTIILKKEITLVHNFPFGIHNCDLFPYVQQGSRFFSEMARTAYSRGFKLYWLLKFLKCWPSLVMIKDSLSLQLKSLICWCRNDAFWKPLQTYTQQLPNRSNHFFGDWHLDEKHCKPF